MADVVAFEKRAKEVPPVQWEIRLNRETYEIEIGVVNDGTVTTLITYSPAKSDPDPLNRLREAWDRWCGETPAAVS